MDKSDLISTFEHFMMPRRAGILKDSSMRDDINKPAECFSEGLHQQVLRKVDDAFHANSASPGHGVRMDRPPINGPSQTCIILAKLSPSTTISFRKDSQYQH